MEVVAAAPRCQLLLIVLMAAMLLPGMKGSPLLVRRKIPRTMELQESIGKAFLVFIAGSDLKITVCHPHPHNATVTYAMKMDLGMESL
ncbi:hypothetical protein STEG23_005924 [Scotinomys teguina]